MKYLNFALLLILWVTAQAQTPNFNFVNLNTVQNFSGCTSETMVLSEESQEEFLWDAIDARGRVLKFRELLEMMYEDLENKFDFFVIAVQDSPASYQHGVVTRLIEGLGGNTIVNRYSDISTRLMSLGEVGFFSRFRFDPPYQDTDTIESRVMRSEVGGVLHELSHHWCCYLEGFYEDRSLTLPAHWISHLDLFSGDTNYAYVLTPTHWVVTEEDEICVNGNYPDKQKKFPPLSQYLMGLIPPDEVPDAIVNEFRRFNGPDSVYNISGPTCNAFPVFTGQRIVPIEEIISYNGERIPRAEDEQKDFRVGWFILVPYGHTLDTMFVRYVNEIKAAVPDAWSFATDGRSRLTYDCDEVLSVEETPQARRENFLDVRRMGRNIRVSFFLKQSEQVQLQVVNIRGRGVATVLESSLNQGRHTVTWDGVNQNGNPVASGTYILRMVVGDRAYVKKVAVVE